MYGGKDFSDAPKSVTLGKISKNIIHNTFRNVKLIFETDQYNDFRLCLLGKQQFVLISHLTLLIMQLYAVLSLMNMRHFL